MKKLTELNHDNNSHNYNTNMTVLISLPFVFFYFVAENCWPSRFSIALLIYNQFSLQILEVVNACCIFKCKLQATQAKSTWKDELLWSIF